MTMTIHEINGYIHTIYLVEEGGDLLLLDGCSRPDVPVVESFITNQLGKTLDQLKLVISTHPHPDHFGGLGFFKKMGIPVAGPEEINFWYLGIAGRFRYFVDIFLMYLVAVNKKRGLKNILFSREVDLDYVLKDGMAVPGFKSWTVMECSGHTNMDLTLYHEEQKIAYVADNLISTKTSAYTPYPIYNPEKYRETLERYLNSDIEEYLLAHQGRIRISKERIKRLRDKVSMKPKRHRNTLHAILFKLFMSMFR
jgi:glyoxylase-like metal-dependent hydrolase (beta-lactamase superfamily II)